MNKRKIISFLALSFVLLGFGRLLTGFIGDGLLEMLAAAIFMAWIPGLSAIIVQKWVFNEPLADLGIQRKNLGSKWLLVSIFGPYLVTLGVLLLVFIAGNLLSIPGFGNVILGDETARIDLLGHLPGIFVNAFVDIYMPQELWIIIVMVLVLAFFFGPTFNLLFTFGEELAMRGLLMKETRSLGFLGSNFLIGSFWAIWYLPSLLQSPEMASSVSVWAALAILISYFVSMSFPLSYLAWKSNTVWAPAIFRGVFSLVGMVTIFFIWGENPLIGSVSGIAGTLVFMLITYFIIRFDPAFVDNYKDLEFFLPSADEENDQGESTD